MNAAQYAHYKKKYNQLLQAFQTHKDAKQLILELTKIDFDDPHKEITYTGNDLQTISCYFPKNILTVRGIRHD